VGFRTVTRNGPFAGRAIGAASRLLRDFGSFRGKQDSSAVGAYSDDMKIPDSPEYDYSARDPVLARLQVPRVTVTVNGV
jgi:hypothetical protein